MKNIFKYFLLLGVLTNLYSCSDDFLESAPTELMSEADRLELSKYNEEIYNGNVRGLYSLMFQTRTGGTTGHDDFGQKGYDIQTDMLCGDMVLGGYNYNWYRTIAQMTATVDNTNTPNYMPWRYYYRIILSANNIIDGLGGVDATLEDDEAKWQMGQAQAMRAYCYFYLANLFVNEYNPDVDALPIYTSGKQEAVPLSKLSDVYDLIIKDLLQAQEYLLNFDRSSEGLFTVNEDVANGLLAYAYITTGEYTKAAETAQKVIDVGYDIVPFDAVANGYDIARNAFSYIDGEGADWIWGMDLTLDQGLDLVSWWGQMDYFTYSYAAVGDYKLMDDGLYNSIPENDARSMQFLNKGLPAPIPWGKFHHEAKRRMGQREITSDYVYMRVEEMYLIKAEAEAFGGSDEAARNTLKPFLSERVMDPSYIDALGGQDLKDEIYKQWRIEMWGEGKSYLAMKRNKATITRGAAHIDYANESIKYNDDRLTFMIPYQEIQDNPFIHQ